jgi:hypothetical protein
MSGGGILSAARLALGILSSRLLGAAEPGVPMPSGPDAARAAGFRARVDVERLRRDVITLSSPRGRRHAPEAMAQAQQYVQDTLERAGWSVRRRPFPVQDPSGALTAVNLTAQRHEASGRPAFVVGAHLDTVPGSPGADDNASGVACLLELARILTDQRFNHDLVLTVFDEEETGLLGSRVLAKQLVSERPLAGVIIYECVGYGTSQPGTQTLPNGTEFIFGAQLQRMRARDMRGDWTLFIYRSSAQTITTTLAGYLSQLAGSEAVLLARDPLELPMIGALLRRPGGLGDQFARSDHKPFWDLGVPAVQLTDTANFRNPNYHLPSDTPDTLNYARMADITAATAATLARLPRQV